MLVSEIKKNGGELLLHTFILSRLPNSLPVSNILLTKDKKFPYVKN